MAASPLGDPLIGATLAHRFEILSWIAQRGASAVYRARLLHVDRTVAIHVVGAASARDPAWVKALIQVATAAARVDHPNLAEVFDVGETHDGRPFVVTELVQGRSLAAVLASVGRLGTDRALRILMQVGAALHEAHSAGLVHGGIHPGCILLVARASRRVAQPEEPGEEDLVKVLDLWIATRAGAPSEVGPDDAPAYLSPEQVRGLALTPGADVYACGVLGYEMLNGAPPFASARPAEVLQRHLRALPAPLIDVPGQVQDLIMRALAKAPELRPASAAELSEACASYLGLRADGPPQACVSPAAFAASSPTAPVTFEGVVELSLDEREPGASGTEQASRAVDSPSSRLSPGWLAVDAPRVALVEAPVKIKALAIRDGLLPLLLQEAEHPDPLIKQARLGDRCRVTLRPDDPAAFLIEPLSVEVQPILADESTCWEWIVTPRRAGAGRVLRVTVTNLLSLSGHEVEKSLPSRPISLDVCLDVAGADRPGLPQRFEGRPLDLFCCYAQRDRELRQDLEAHLSLLRRQGAIALTHDRCVLPGEDQATVIDRLLETADMILLLLSADFLASDFCYLTQLSQALIRHEQGRALVLPILARPVDLRGAPFGHLPTLPRGGAGRAITLWPDRDEAWLQVSTEIRALVEQRASRGAW